jgi:Putative Actinobacterial Holin-X, holin superfamily III
LFHPLFHPFLRLVTARPELLADHAEAYAELFASELGSAGSSLKRQVLLNGLALCGLGVGAVLAGVALMLWAVLPMAQSQAPWALLVVPVLPFIMAGICLLAASRYAKLKPFSHIRRQMAADLAMVREVGSA